MERMHRRPIDYSLSLQLRYNNAPRPRSSSAQSPGLYNIADLSASSTGISLTDDISVCDSNRRKEFFSRVSNSFGNNSISCMNSTMYSSLIPGHQRNSSTVIRREIDPKLFKSNQNWNGTQKPHRLLESISNKPITRTRSSTNRFFIPPARKSDEGKLVVVLDLDETLVYSRAGPILLRPGMHRLFQVLRGRSEIVVWTAGEKDYAMEVIEQIDPQHNIQHCIYRHEKWWTETPGYVKDINALGRPLDRTIIIDNTPDCLRANPRNGLLVTDFRGERGPRLSFDTTLFVLADIIDDILRDSAISIESFHGHPQLLRRAVACDTGGTVEVLTLRQDHHFEASAPRRRCASVYRTHRVAR